MDSYGLYTLRTWCYRQGHSWHVTTRGTDCYSLECRAAVPAQTLAAAGLAAGLAQTGAGPGSAAAASPGPGPQSAPWGCSGSAWPWEQSPASGSAFVPRTRRAWMAGWALPAGEESSPGAWGAAWAPSRLRRTRGACSGAGGAGSPRGTAAARPAAPACSWSWEEQHWEPAPAGERERESYRAWNHIYPFNHSPEAFSDRILSVQADQPQRLLLQVTALISVIAAISSQGPCSQIQLCHAHPALIPLPQRGNPPNASNTETHRQPLNRAISWAKVRLWHKMVLSKYPFLGQDSDAALL